MSEPTFQIVFRGKILAGFSRDQVRANLAQLFRIEPARVDAMLDAPKTVLKTGLDKDAASRYQEALRGAGIMVAVIGETETRAAVEPARAPQAAAITREIVPIPDRGNGGGTSPAEPTPAFAQSGLTLAEPGAQLLPPVVRTRAEIDTSALSLAQPGVVLVEKRPVAPLEVDLSGISLGDINDPIVPHRHAQPPAIDTSALSLAEPPPEIEKPLTDLQKLLTTSAE